MWGSLGTVAEGEHLEYGSDIKYVIGKGLNAEGFSHPFH